LQPDLDPELRASQERKRAGLEAQLAEQKQRNLERKLAVRYHKVRFFERVKFERRVTQLESAARACAEKGQPPPEGFAEELGQAKADLRYTTHFPKGEKYVSLLKEGETPEAQAHLERERARLRALVHRAAEEEALLVEGDEGRGLHKSGAKGGKQKGREGKHAEVLAGGKAAAAVGSGTGDGDDFFLEDDAAAAAAAKERKKGAKRAREEESEEGQEGAGGGDGEAASGRVNGKGDSGGRPRQGGAPREGETEKERKARWKKDRKLRAREAKRERVNKRAADKAAGLPFGSAAKKLAKAAAKANKA